MKILLLGEYSNVHWTLAEGLRALGHDVCVLSNGDFWKKYQADLLLERTPGKIGGISYLLKFLRILPELKGYDVVQLINPCFLELKVERNLTVYHYLKKHNKKVFLGAYGNDYYWINTCVNTDVFRYSDFKIVGKERLNDYTRGEIKDWIGSAKEVANKEIAETCDGIIAGLYEYYASYLPDFKEKLSFIPFPINQNTVQCEKAERDSSKPVDIFIGIQKHRSIVKGTDVMYRALERVYEKYPDECNIIKAVSVPYHQYQQMMNDSDVILDQLYSYTPAMNALLAMAKGLVVVGGGEPENYEILGEETLRPIINVLPDEEDVFTKLEDLVLHRERIPELSAQSIEYIRKHHDHIKVAQAYLDFWR